MVVPAWLLRLALIVLSASVSVEKAKTSCKIAIVLTGQLRLYKLGHQSFLAQLHEFTQRDCTVIVAPYVSLNFSIASWKTNETATALRKAMMKYSMNAWQLEVAKSSWRRAGIRVQDISQPAKKPGELSSQLWIAEMRRRAMDLVHPANFDAIVLARPDLTYPRPSPTNPVTKAVMHAVESATSYSFLGDHFLVMSGKLAECFRSLLRGYDNNITRRRVAVERLIAMGYPVQRAGHVFFEVELLDCGGDKLYAAWPGDDGLCKTKETRFSALMCPNPFGNQNSPSRNFDGLYFLSRNSGILTQAIARYTITTSRGKGLELEQPLQDNALTAVFWLLEKASEASVTSMLNVSVENFRTVSAQGFMHLKYWGPEYFRVGVVREPCNYYKLAFKQEVKRTHSNISLVEWLSYILGNTSHAQGCGILSMRLWTSVLNTSAGRAVKKEYKRMYGESAKYNEGWFGGTPACPFADCVAVAPQPIVAQCRSEVEQRRDVLSQVCWVRVEHLAEDFDFCMQRYQLLGGKMKRATQFKQKPTKQCSQSNSNIPATLITEVEKHYINVFGYAEQCCIS